MNVHFYIEADDLLLLTEMVKTYGSLDADSLGQNPIPYSLTPKAFKNFENAMEVSLNVQDFIRLNDTEIIEKIELIAN